MAIPLELHLIPLPTPFPVGPVNVYLAEGDPLTLIDTGPKDDATRAALEAGLTHYGYRIEDLRRVILTHHHVDHVGLTAEIVARSGAEVLTHPLTQPWLTDPMGERERHRPFFQKIWDEGGVPAEIVRAMAAAGEGLTRWADPVTSPIQTIDEGDPLSLAGETWRVYHTPGHAGGLICLWEPTSRTLLANDHLIRDISSNPTLEPPPLTPAPTDRCGVQGPRPKRLVEYLRHMQRMAALKPAIALPGHGEVVEDVAELVRQRLAFHQRRARKILETLNGRSRTLWELTQPLFPWLKRGVDFFLALSEVLGHLDVLEGDGAVRPEREGERVKWVRA